MLCYQENNELQRDFHGTVNAALNYIADRNPGTAGGSRDDQITGRY